MLALRTNKALRTLLSITAALVAATLILLHLRPTAWTPPSLLPSAGVLSSYWTPTVKGNRIRWDDGPIPQTTIVQHVTGWTVLDNLYTFNGTLMIVTDDPASFPPIRELISSGRPAWNGKQESELQEPTESDTAIISSAVARKWFGQSANAIKGVSFMSADPEQFVDHYYHFTAEILAGLWRTYSSLDTNITPDGQTTLPPPSRLIFPNLPYLGWVDNAGMNQIVLRGAFPSVSFEYEEDWTLRAMTQQPFMFDRVVLTARTAVHRSRLMTDGKILSVADQLPKSPYWWEPVRKNVLEFAGASKSSRPVVTYISRQGRSRALIQADHDDLVKSLKGLEAKYGWEVNIAVMEKFSKLEQFQIAARTTIMIGVHGNGLTSLLWMQPSPSATVIEINFDKGFSSDYQVTANVTGIEHYGVWYDHYWRSNSEWKPKRDQPEGFHGSSITVHGPTVAALVEERILDPMRFSSRMESKPRVNTPPEKPVQKPIPVGG